MAQIGVYKLQTANGVVEVPVFDPADTNGSALRVQTASGVGAINVVDPSTADFPYLRIQTANGVRALTGALGNPTDDEGGTDTGGEYDGPAGGGDGIGAGSPGFSITSSRNAVTDLGMDNSGGTAINGALKSALVDGREIVFPPGTYKINPEPPSGIVLSDNVWLRGSGDFRSDVHFILPANTSARMFNFSANTALSNLTLDQSNHPDNWIQNTSSGTANTYWYNVAQVGEVPIQADLPGPRTDSDTGNAAITVGMESGATFHLENFEYIAPEAAIVDYPGNCVGIQAPLSHEGLFEAVNCRIANRGEHAIYASRCRGDVHIDGGYFHNNLNTNMRISGGGSWMQNATIHLNPPVGFNREQDTGGVKSMRGLRWEAGNTTLGGKTGGYIQNCDFVKTESITAASHLIQIDGNAGSMEVRGCRFRDESRDGYDVIYIQEIGDGPQGITPPTPHDVTVDSCSFTGGGDPAAVRSLRSGAPTTVSNNCLGMPGGPGFTGAITESGTTYSGCARASI